MKYVQLYIAVAVTIIVVRSFMSATRQDLDQAIADAAAETNQAFTDLEAKIAAGQVTTPEDFSAEVASLKAIVTAGQTADPAVTTTAATTT